MENIKMISQFYLSA